MTAVRVTLSRVRDGWKKKGNRERRREEGEGRGLRDRLMVSRCEDLRSVEWNGKRKRRETYIGCVSDCR